MTSDKHLPLRPLASLKLMLLDRILDHPAPFDIKLTALVPQLPTVQEVVIGFYPAVDTRVTS
jgi:hypothetical protein